MYLHRYFKQENESRMSAPPRTGRSSSMGPRSLHTASVFDRSVTVFPFLSFLAHFQLKCNFMVSEYMIILTSNIWSPWPINASRERIMIHTRRILPFIQAVVKSLLTTTLRYLVKFLLPRNISVGESTRYLPSNFFKE